MKIRFGKYENGHRLICLLEDGTTEMAALGPTLPFHDMAHFVVERNLNLKHGFFGNIANGFSVNQLSDKNFIKTLPQESLEAEIITRALQSLYSGACGQADFHEMIASEFDAIGIKSTIDLNSMNIEKCLVQYANLLNQWHLLKLGEYLEIDW